MKRTWRDRFVESVVMDLCDQLEKHLGAVNDDALYEAVTDATLVDLEAVVSAAVRVSRRP